LGLRDLRPLQREAMDAALAGRDTLVVMPTAAESRSATRSGNRPRLADGRRLAAHFIDEDQVDA